MNRARYSQILGYAALGLLLAATLLSMIDASETTWSNAALAAGVACLAAYLALQRTALRAFWHRRSARHGANMIVMVLLFSSVVVIIQAMSMRHNARYDLTRNKRFSLAEQTTSVLGTLQDKLQVTAFFTDGSSESDIVDALLSQYAFHSTHFHYEFVDPDRDPQRARDMDVNSSGVIIMSYAGRQERITDISEESLTNAVLRLSREEVAIVYFVIGHREKDVESKEPAGYSILKEVIERQSYSARRLSLFETPSVPDDCALLVVAGPESDYFETEIEKIRRFFDTGGSGIFLIDPQAPLPNLEALLDDYRILLEQDVIIDPYGRIFGGSYTVPVVTQYVDHPITRAMQELTFFPRARSVNLSAVEIPGVKCQYLALAGKSAWGEIDLEGVRNGEAKRDSDDISPPVGVAAIAARTVYIETEDRHVDSKVVVIGDSDFANNASFRVSGNGDLFLNSLNYLAGQKDLIAIPSKQGLGDRLFLTATQARFVFFVCVILLPLSVLGVGTTVLIRRRRRT